jgi:putative transposase
MSRHGFKARPNDARRLKALEQENSRLKRLLADAMLDNVVLKDLLGKP